MECVNFHHAGVWVDDIDEAIAFFTGVMGLPLLTRGPRGNIGPGERALIRAGDREVIELLTEPNVEPRPDFAVHPLGHVVGIPHLCFKVTDLPAWGQKLEEKGYAVTGRLPAKGFMQSELGRLRLLFFTGPAGIGFELFEFEEEYPLDRLAPR
jgi:catechol 2,3-dioxygenase-like lactoylglutathione lyase family enzyme